MIDGIDFHDQIETNPHHEQMRKNQIDISETYESLTDTQRNHKCPQSRAIDTYSVDSRFKLVSESGLGLSLYDIKKENNVYSIQLVST